jgi:membrane-bound serine protease (ClpP class)
MERFAENLITYVQCNIGDSFIRLFTEMSALVVVFFVLGLVFCILELFTPGVGVFGITGALLIVVAIIIRMANGGDIYMLSFMILFAVIIIGGFFILISRSVRKGALSKTKIFHVGTALPTGHTEGTKDFSHLVGAKGKTITFLRPIGKADFGGEIHDVIAKTGFIDENTEVEVIGVEGQRIVVQSTKNK